MCVECVIIGMVIASVIIVVIVYDNGLIGMIIALKIVGIIMVNALDNTGNCGIIYIRKAVIIMDMDLEAYASIMEDVSSLIDCKIKKLNDRISELEKKERNLRRALELELTKF